MTRFLDAVRRIYGEQTPRRWALAGALLATLLAPWWGPSLLRGMSFFRVRHVEVRGARYLPASDVLTRLAVDTTWSVWSDLSVLERRLDSHPQIHTARIERKLPGTLVVTVTENQPIALVPARDGLRAVDAEGRLLPLDPSRVDVDLPVLAGSDRTLIHVLADLRQRVPTLYARISQARRTDRDELLFTLPSLLVRAGSNVSSDRLADIIPVESDLARRHARVAELDLRFRDQVIARLQ